ncbi:MAG: tetratricopeptide repeat protein [Enhygromyxa sp.]
MRPPSAGAVKPPPPPPKLGAKPPPLPPVSSKPPAPRPPPPSHDAFSSGVLPGDSGAFDDDDPFFTGDPEQMSELGSITHGDATQFHDDLPAPRGGVQEFEFDDAGPSLELGDLDLPSATDLPAPVGRPADLDSPDFTGLDLVDDGFVGGDDLDLPAPVAPAPQPDLPAPVRSGPSDLPAPLDDMALDDGLAFDDLPMPADDFPAPGVDDFPAPKVDGKNDGVELDDGFDSLPTSADVLPAEAHDLPIPAKAHGGDLPRSADILPTPVETLGLELDLDPDEAPARQASGEASAKAAEPASKPANKPTGPAVAAEKPKRDVVRYVVYGVLGLAVIVVGGGYVAMEMGLFEPEPPPPPMADRGAEEPEPPPPPNGEPSERSEELLAKLDLDTPAAYVQVLTLAADANDQVAEAEAALLLHYRYGPDPERLARAGQLLANYAGAEQPFVRRVEGLGLLASGKLDEALAYFEAEEPRSQLYRAWALLELDRPEEARKAAEAVTAVRANDRAAALAVLQTRFSANPVDGIAAMRHAAASTNHLALDEALMFAAFAQGRLGEAGELGQKLELGVVSAGHKAEVLRRRGQIAAAQGRLGEATRLLEQALAAEPTLLAARIDRAELWLQNRDTVSLRAELDVLTREHPGDPAVLELAARFDLQSGRADDARGWLEQLGEAGASNPKVHDILGQAHAFANEVEQARAAFARARELDPLYWQASVHEAELLVRDRQVDAALNLLVEQQASLVDAGAQASARGRRALASVVRQRALIERGRAQLDKALTAAEEAIALDPADNDAQLLRAQLLGELGQRKAHEEALTKLHERTGGYPGLTEPLGKMLLRKGKLDELDALLGDSLDSSDAAVEVLLTGAALRLAQERGEEAKQLAQQVLDRDPTQNRAHLLLGRALLLEGEHARALDEIESARTREGDPEVELWLGQALEYNGRAGEARAHYKRALELDPRNLEAAALLGRLYAYDGASRKAIELLKPVVDATNDYPYAWLAIGLAQGDLNQKEAAVASFQKAQQYDPSLFEAYYQEGRIHNDRNQHSAAVKALQAGVDKAADHAQERQLIDAWRRLGEGYHQLGRRSEAKRALEEYLKLAPANAAGRREVERLLRDL